MILLRKLTILVLFLRIPSWLQQMSWGYEVGLKALEKALNNHTNKKSFNRRSG